MLIHDNKDIYNYSDKADLKLYGEAFSWLLKFCEEKNINKETAQKLEFVLEEIYTNICLYAYGDKKGIVEIELYKNENGIVLKFTDSGIPYNPLEKEDPDIELPIEKRTIGGLGIFMVKHTAKNIEYEYKENRNILTVTVG